MKIAVGMSGGVDSTVAAMLLLGQGHEVIGLTMQTWDGSVNLPFDKLPASPEKQGFRRAGSSGHRSACYGPDEAAELDAVRALANRMGIRHYTIPVVSEYRQYVLDYFRTEYLKGRTPNPCVQCNRWVKFGFLLSRAWQAGLDFDYFATGHYARVEYNQDTNRHLLKRGVDVRKDQSYFLAHLSQEQLGKVRFPLGEWSKEQVRDAARSLGMGEVAEQAESQNFIGCRSYEPLFEGVTVAPGPIEDRQGTVVGEHRGIVYYTIGQRRGLKLGGNAEPLYVLAIDVGRNALIVGPREGLLASGLVAVDVNWIAVESINGPTSATVRIRAQHTDTPAVLWPVKSEPPNTVRVEFDVPQMAVTPGQAVVFYQGDTVLGGGWIAQAINPLAADLADS
jgi:tRNA-specific 2-thiouridylase